MHHKSGTETKNLIGSLDMLKSKRVEERKNKLIDRGESNYKLRSWAEMIARLRKELGSKIVSEEILPYTNKNHRVKYERHGKVCMVIQNCIKKHTGISIR